MARQDGLRHAEQTVATRRDAPPLVCSLCVQSVVCSRAIRQVKILGMGQVDDIWVASAAWARQQFEEDQAERKRVLGAPIGGTLSGPPGLGPAVAGIAGVGRGLPPGGAGWAAGVRIPVAMPDGTVQPCTIGSDGVIHPTYPAGADDRGGPYTVWTDNCSDGWGRSDPYDTLAECFDYITGTALTSRYQITKDVQVEFKEAT